MALEAEKEFCAQLLEDLKREVFVPEVELTLIMRHPADPECYLMVTRDDPRAVLDVVTRVVAEET